MAQQAPRRRQYDKQFKIDAVEMTLKGDKSTKEIADDLGVNPHVLYHWRTKYQKEKESAFPGTGNPKDSEAEQIRKLERELKAVIEEREILKSMRCVCAGNSLIYSFISEYKKMFAVRTMCRVLGVSVSGYYAWGATRSRVFELFFAEPVVSSTAPTGTCRMSNRPV